MILFRLTNNILNLKKKRWFSSTYQTCLVKYAGLMGSFAFVWKWQLSWLDSIFNDLVLFTGDSISLTFQNKEATNNNRTNLFDSPCTLASICAMLSLKNVNTRFFTKSVSSPGQILLRVVWFIVINWKRKPSLKSSVATVSFLQSVVKTDPALKLIFIHRTSYCDITTISKDSLMTWARTGYWVTRIEFIMPLEPSHPHRRSYLTNSNLNHRGVGVSQTNTDLPSWPPEGLPRVPWHLTLVPQLYRWRN